MSEIREALALIEPELILADGYDQCITGVAMRAGTEDSVAYDVECIIKILERDMSPEDAHEFFEHNILMAYVGDRTPVFISKVDVDEN